MSQRCWHRGGVAVTLADAPNDKGGSWSEDGTIVFTPKDEDVFFRVSSAGGIPEPLTSLDKEESEVTHRWPQFLPGGGAVLFTASAVSYEHTNAHIVVHSLESGETKIIHRGGFLARYLESGHLVYAHDGRLFAAPFDSSRMELTGPPFPALDHMVTRSVLGAGQFAASSDGSLVYVPGEGFWIDGGYIDWQHRDGQKERLRSEFNEYLDLKFSPDGRRLALTLRDPQLNVWVYEWERDTMSRVTFGEADITEDVGWPVWTPDGRRIAFGSDRDSPGMRNLYWTRADGSGQAERLAESPHDQTPFSWDPSGKLLAFTQRVTRDGPRDVLMLPMEGDETSGWTPREPTPLLDGPFDETQPAFSPDGRWLAYASNESGRFEVYVRPFPSAEGKWQISTDGGTYPTWSPKRNELFFYHTAGCRSRFHDRGGRDGETRTGGGQAPRQSQETVKEPRRGRHVAGSARNLRPGEAFCVGARPGSMYVREHGR